MLDERKQNILKAIINSYLVTAEPIGSRTISKDYDLGVSSATIRNEMSDLEDLGYLNKPHTSAGRVPSDKAYRLYVDILMKRDFIDNDIKVKKLLDTIKDDLDREIEDIIISSSKILSSLTNYTTLAISPQVRRENLHRIQLVSINERDILIVLIVDSGIVKNIFLKTKNRVDQNTLEKISNLLNDILRMNDGLNLESEDLTNLDSDLKESEPLIENIIVTIENNFLSSEGPKIYTTGINQIFNYPEYKDIEKARSFIDFIENDRRLLELFMKSNRDTGIEVSIGQENTIESLKESSFLTASYKVGSRTIGKIGIIGPTRMDYGMVINALDVFSYTLTEVLGTKL